MTSTILWFGGHSELGVAVTVPTDGNCVSLTVMVCWQVAILFDASVAFQVMVVVPTGYGALSASESLRVPLTVTAQLSVAVAVPGFTTAEH